MKKLMKFGPTLLMALAMGCGSQVVEFPEEGDKPGVTVDSGTPSDTQVPVDTGNPVEDTGAPNEDTSKPFEDTGGLSEDTGSPFEDTGSVTDTGSQSDTGSVTDTGFPSEDTGSVEDTGTPSDTGEPSEDTGSVTDTGSQSDTGSSGDTGSVTDTGSATDSCPLPPPPTCGGKVCSDSEVCKDGTCVCNGEPAPTKWCGKGKVLLCHYPPGNPSNRHEICVGSSAVPAHMKHGDTYGCCH